MQVAEGILTARGGLVSHAAVVARGLGHPRRRRRRRRQDRRPPVHRRRRHGERGRRHLARRHHRRGRPRRDGAGRRPSRRRSSTPSSRWADEVRQGQARRCGPTPTPARTPPGAREFGAEGIGLCRTEHMFLGEDRLPIVRRMILADTPEEETAALERAAQSPRRPTSSRSSRPWTACPVTVRLLDPPLHEFLPDRRGAASCKRGRPRASTAEEADLLAAAQSWRGVQPDARHPWRAPRRAQARPLRHAGAGAHGGGRRARTRPASNPVVEIMIPLTVTREELAAGPRLGGGRHRGRRRAATRRGSTVTIGTMIETPRAALRADEIAEVADFFSFGTNDLTQMTFGFSRDDVEAPDDAGVPRAGAAAAQPVRDDRPDAASASW